MNVPTQQGFATVTPTDAGRGPLVVVQQTVPRRRWRVWLLALVLAISVAFNFGLYSAYHTYLGTGDGVVERFYGGDLGSLDKIAPDLRTGDNHAPFHQPCAEGRRTGGNR